MKNILKALFIFSATLLGSILAIGVSYLVYLLGSKLYLYPQLKIEQLFSFLPHIIITVFLPSSLLALLAALVFLRRKQSLVFLLYLFFGALTFMLLYFGPAVLNTFLTEQFKAKNLNVKMMLRDLDYPQKLIALQNGWLYFEKCNNNILQNGFVILSKPQGLYSFRSSQVSFKETGELYLKFPNGEEIILQSRLVEKSSFQLNSNLTNLISLFSSLNNFFLKASQSNQVEYLFSCFLLVAFILSCSLFLRSTKWPLANFFITVLVIILILLIYNFTIQEVLPELAKIWGASAILKLIPQALLLFFTVFFFLFDFVFLPEKKQRVNYE